MQILQFLLTNITKVNYKQGKKREPGGTGSNVFFLMQAKPNLQKRGKTRENPN